MADRGEHLRSGLIAGFDVNGFSAIVEQAILEHGRHAGELAGAALAYGSRAARQVLAENGLEAFEATGDGMVFVQSQAPLSPPDPAAIEHHLARARELHHRGTGIAIRTAWVEGSYNVSTIAPGIMAQPQLIWGPAIAQLHGLLAAAPRTASRLDPAIGNKLLGDAAGSINEELSLFVRFHGPADWPGLDWPRFEDALGLATDWARSAGGVPERLGHDEKGIALRVAFRDPTLYRTEIASGAQGLVRTLCERGFNAATALENGPVFRGTDGTMVQVHGGAINRAAKTCAALPSGAASVPELAAGAPAMAQAASVGLLGRASEVAACDRKLGKLPACVLVYGEAGIGKTHLVRHLFRQRSQAANPAWYRCTARTPVEPFSCARGIVAALVAASGSLPIDAILAQAAIPEAFHAECRSFASGCLPDDVGNPAGDATLRAHYLITFGTAVISAVAQREPVLIAIDDAHLIDRFSARLFAALLGSGAQVGILGSCRPVEGESGLTELRRTSAAHAINLAPVDAETIRAIASSQAGIAPDRLDEIVRLANGNPFVATQAADWSEGEAVAGSPVANLVLGRVRKLPIAEQLVLRTAVLSGTASTQSEIAAILIETSAAVDVAQAIERLCGLGLMQPAVADSQRYEPAHDLIARSIQDDMSLGARRTIGKGAALCLWREVRLHGDQGGRLVRLADYWKMAQSDGRAALCFARAAADAAQSGYFSVAVELYDRALAAAERTPRPFQQAIRWQSFRAEALWSLGELSKARDTARGCLDDLAGTRNRHLKEARLRSATLLSETAVFTGRSGDLLTGYSIMMRGSFGGAGQMLEHGRSYATLSYFAGLARFEGISRYFYRRADRLSARSGDPRPVAFALASEGLLDLVFCRWQRARETFEQGLACLKDCESEHHLKEVLTIMICQSEWLPGNVALARPYSDRLGQMAALRGNRLHQGWSAYVASFLDLMDGELVKSRASLALAREHLEGLGDTPSEHIMLGIETRLLWAEGKWREALAAARQAGEFSRSQKPINHSSVEGFSAAPLIGALALMQRGENAQEGADLLRRYLPPLKRFAWVFPLARSRLAAVNLIAAHGKRGSSDPRKIEHFRRRCDATGMVGDRALVDRAIESERKEWA